jgi:hypothetical protein
MGVCVETLQGAGAARRAAICGCSDAPSTSFIWKCDSRLFQSGCFANTRGLPSSTRPYLRHAHAYAGAHVQGASRLTAPARARPRGKGTASAVHACVCTTDLTKEHVQHQHRAVHTVPGAGEGHVQTPRVAEEANALVLVGAHA